MNKTFKICEKFLDLQCVIRGRSGMASGDTEEVRGEPSKSEMLNSPKC